MGKIIRLTESELVNLVKRVISEEKKMINEGALSSPSVQGYKVINSNGWLKDSKGDLMCVKVVASTGKVFAQGISNIKSDGAGGAVIEPTDAMWGFGSIPMDKNEVATVLKTLKSGGTSKTPATGATIYIGKSLVPWCKAQWSK